MKRLGAILIVTLFIFGCDTATRIYNSIPEDKKEEIKKKACDEVPGNAYGLCKEDLTVEDSLE